jgi:queuine tRNA-ribosyltransferase
VHLKAEKHQRELSPLDPETLVPGTEKFTRAYVSHLLRSGEMLGQIIASMHNLGFIIQLVDGAREAIEEGRFTAYREDFVQSYYAPTIDK